MSLLHFRYTALAVFLFSLSPTHAFGQVSVVSAASGSLILSPGSLACAFGSNLAASTAQAQGAYPVTSLDGVSVQFGTTPAPLLAVSPTQITLIVPPDVALGQASVTVFNRGVAVANGTVSIS